MHLNNTGTTRHDYEASNDGAQGGGATGLNTGKARTSQIFMQN